MFNNELNLEWSVATVDDSSTTAHLIKKIKQIKKLVRQVSLVCRWSSLWEGREGPQFFVFQTGGCIFTKHTSFMSKNTINNVIAKVASIVIVVVIIITSAGGGA